MKNQLINLSLLNGGTPLSEKTLTNLDLYLRNKYQTAGSSSGATVAASENPGLVKSTQNLVSWIQSFGTGVDVSQLEKISTELAGAVDSLDTEVRQLNPTQIRDFVKVINQLKSRVGQVKADNREIKSSITNIEGQITTINESFDAYRDQLQGQLNEFIRQHDQNYEQFTRENSGAISEATGPIQEQVDRIKAQMNLSEESRFSRKFAEYDQKQLVLDNKIQQEQSKINGLTIYIRELNKKVTKNTDDIKQNLKQHQALSQKITNTNVQMQQRTDALKKEIINKYKYLEGRINAEKKELQEELNRQNLANEKKIGKINETISSIEQQIGKETEDRKIELQEQKNQLEGQLSQLKASNEQLESSLNLQIAYLYYQLNGVLRERDIYYTSLLADHNQRIFILEELNKTLNTKIDTTNTDLTGKLQSGLQRQQETIDKNDRKLKEIIQQNLDQEKRERDALQGEINVLKSQITEEVRRAQAAEKDLSDRIQGEARQAQAAERELYEMIKKEIRDAQAAEKDLSDKINANKAEESRLRKQMEQDLRKYITLTGTNLFNDSKAYTEVYTDEEIKKLNIAIMKRESELRRISDSIDLNLQDFIGFQNQQNAILNQRINQTQMSINNLSIRIDQALRNLDVKIYEETSRATAAENKEIQKRKKISKDEAIVRKKADKNINKRLQKSEQRASKTKREFTSSIDELTSTVETIEAKFESQSVINQHMVDVLRKLNSENLENQEKLRKIKKTPFGAFI